MKRHWKFLGQVAELGCIITKCKRPATIHHVRKHGERRDDRKVIPLCPDHHQQGGYGVAIEDGKKKWRENFGNEVDMVREVYEQLGIEPDEDVKGWLKRYGTE